jgi:hypothetical protein
MALKLKKIGSPLLLAGLLMMSSANASAATDPFNDGNPSALAMAGDLFLVRPFGAVATVLGAGVYVISLPFTLASGGATEAGYVLVAEPAMYTFVRCLGCTRPGYNKGARDAKDNQAEKSDEASLDAAEETGAAATKKNCKNYACKGE